MYTQIYEVGVVTAHPIKFCWILVKMIIATWRYCLAVGLPANKWWGVYIKGTESVVVLTGCMPDAQSRASRIAEVMNDDFNKKGEK